MLRIEAQVGDIGEVLKTLTRMEHGDLRNMQEAVKTATEYVQQTWIKYASGVQVQYSGGTFKIKVVTGEYIRSIANGLNYPAMGDKFTGEVFTLSPHGRIVESGIKPFDMKAGLLSSAKAKTGKDGKRYITITFRHNTPGSEATAQAMPERIYADAKNLMYSRKNGMIRKWWTGQNYTWGDRLGKSADGQQTKLTNQGGRGYRGSQGDSYTWTTGRYSGMVKMGKTRHSQYLTFRRVSENSPASAFQHPGVEPRPIREAVVQSTQKEVIELIRSGFELDLLGL
jgi:hypothetical protein